MQFSKILSSNIVNNMLIVNRKAASYVQNPIQKRDVFVKTSDINFSGESVSYKKESELEVVKDLKDTGKNALNSLENQIASDGWAGKAADWISGAWKSKNRAHIVRADIEAYQTQIDELDKSIKENKFEEKFKDIFKVDYNSLNIKKYNEKLENFTLATTSHCVASIVKEKLEPHLIKYDNTKGELEDKEDLIPDISLITGLLVYYKTFTPKEDILKGLEDSLKSLVGGEEWLEKIAKSQGVDIKKAKDEEKYKVYGQIGKYLIETTKQTAQRCCGDKKLEDIKNEYEEAYTNAYGAENDIQERVDKYNRSQEIGAAAVRGVIRSGIVAATVATAGAGGVVGIALGAGTTFGAKMLVEVIDKATNDIDNSQDLSKKVLKKMAKSAAISSADYIATKGLKKLIPNVDTTSGLFNVIADTGKDVLIDTTSGMIGEYFKQGKWYTNQIGPRMLISLTFNKLGTDNPVTKELMNLTKGGINQAMKKKFRDNESVKTFITDSKKELEENYINNPEKFSALKLLAMKCPVLFEDFIIKSLEEYTTEKSKTAKDSMTYHLKPEENID